MDTRYLQKTGGSISSNLIINGSLDVKTNITLPEIGDVENAIQGKQDELTEGTNISIVDNEVSCDLSAGTNIDITDGVISTTGLQDEITSSTDLNSNTLTAVGNITTTGYVNDASKRYVISGTNFDLDGLTTFNLKTNENWLTDFVSHDGNGRYDVINLPSIKYFILTIMCPVSSDVYDSGISWRLRVFRNGINFSAFGSQFCFTNGASSQQSEVMLLSRTFHGINNQSYFNFVIDQERGTGTHGELMDGSKVLSGVSIYFEIVG